MKKIIQIALLLIVTTLIYSNIFQAEFVFDDIEFISQNVYIKEFSRMGGFWKEGFPKTRLIPLYSFALNYYFHRINPEAYHVTNVLIHFLVALAVWWFMSLIFLTPALSGKRIFHHRHLISFLSALLFAVHPANTQAVSYISQRFASIATLFYILSLCLYLKGRMTIGRPIKMSFLFGGALLMALGGFLSKEISITIPLAIVCIEIFMIILPCRDNQLIPKDKQKVKASKKNKAVREDTPDQPEKRPLIKPLSARFFFIAGISFLVTIMIFFSFYPGRISQILFAEQFSESHKGDVINFVNYQLTQTRVWATFFRLLFIPINQNLDYDFTVSKTLFSPPSTLFSLLLLIGLVILIFKTRKNFPLISFGLLWFFVTLTANLVPRVNVIFEHKLYLVTAGFSVFFCAGLYHLCKNIKIARILIVILICLFSVLTYQRNWVWQNEITLWHDVAKKSPNKYRPYHNMGTAYLKKGYYTKAIEYLNMAIEKDPDNEKLYTTRGAAFYHAGQYREALDDLNKAVDLDPKYYGAYCNRGLVYEKINQPQLAFNDYQQALKIHNSFALGFIRRGYLLSESGHHDLALKDFDNAIKVNPDGVDAYVGKAITLFRLNQPEAALDFFDQALSIDPRSSVAYDNRGFYFFLRQQWQESLNDFNEAVAVQPNNASAYNHRGLLHRAMNKHQLALADFTKTLELTPLNYNAYNNRGAVLIALGESEAAIKDFTTSLEIAPGYDGAYNNRGFIYSQRGQFELAIKDFNKCIELNPNNDSVYYNRGLVYMQQREFDLAFDDFAQAIQINAGYTNAYYQQGLIYAQREEHESAVQVLSKAIEQQPQFAQVYWARARSYRAQDKLKASLQDAQTAQRLGLSIDEGFITGLKAQNVNIDSKTN